MTVSKKHIRIALLAFAVSLAVIAAPCTAAYAADGQEPDIPPEQIEISEPADISEAELTLSADCFVYTGRAAEPEVTLRLGETELVRDTDYTLTFAGNIRPGFETASVTAEGIGEYSGSVSARFTIIPAVKEISSLTTRNDAITVSWQADRKALAYQVLYSTTPDFSENVHSTTVKGKTSVCLSNIPKAGERWYVKMRAFITDSGELDGRRFGTYGSVMSIKVKDDIRSVSIPYCSYTYSGKKITPPVTVKCTGGRVLTEGLDYTVRYSENTAVGTAKITVNGVRDIQGSYTKTFVIKPKKNKLTELVSDGRARFTAEWKADKTATGYHVLYSTDPDFKKDVHSYSTDKTRVTFTKYPEAGKTYYVKVRSYLAANGTRYGNYSAVRKVTALNRDINVLKWQLTAAIRNFPGEWSVYVKNLRTQETFQINNKQYYAASLMKLYCMAATYDAIEHGRLEETAVVRAYLESMITVSSDDAFNRLVHLIGKTAVRDWIITNGYTETEQYHGYGAGYDYPWTVIRAGMRNKTTPADCAKFFESVYKGECVSKAASQKMLALLKRQKVRYKAPAVIPAGVQTANKTGEVNNNTHDCMLVFLDGDPYIFSVMSEIRGAGWANAYHIRELSKITYDFFANNRN